MKHVVCTAVYSSFVLNAPYCLQWKPVTRICVSWEVKCIKLFLSARRWVHILFVWLNGCLWTANGIVENERTRRLWLAMWREIDVVTIFNGSCMGGAEETLKDLPTGVRIADCRKTERDSWFSVTESLASCVKFCVHWSVVHMYWRSVVLL